MSFAQGDGDLPANQWCFANSEDAFHNMKVEVKMTDFDHPAHSEKKNQIETTQISPEQLNIIKELSLSYLEIGNYLVIVKSDFDMVISEEPYLALMLLFNTKTKIGQQANQRFF